MYKLCPDNKIISFFNSFLDVDLVLGLIGSKQGEQKMFKITFEAKNMKDLQTQVNELVETADAVLNDSGSQVQHTNENRNQQVKLTPVAPVPAPIDPQPQQPMPAAVAVTVRQEPAPISPDVPWDARIHSSSKSKVKSGAWKKRKGVAEDLYISVMAELQSGGDQPAPVIATPPAPLPTMAPVVPPLIQESPMVQPTQPLAPPVMTPVAQPPVAQPPVAPPNYTPAPVPDSTKPAHNFDTFKSNFAQVMAQLKGEGHLTPEYIGSLNEHFGVSELWELASDDVKLGELFQNFADFGWVTKV